MNSQTVCESLIFLLISSHIILSLHELLLTSQTDAYLYILIKQMNSIPILIINIYILFMFPWRHVLSFFRVVSQGFHQSSHLLSTNSEKCFHGYRCRWVLSDGRPYFTATITLTRTAGRRSRWTPRSTAKIRSVVILIL